MNKITLILAMALFSQITFSQEERPGLVTDRPDQTESSVVVPLKSLQIESGISLTKDKFSGMESSNLSIASTLLRYGLLKNAELRFGFNYDQTKMSVGDSDTTQSGFTPLTVGTKIYVSEEKGLVPEIAVIAAFDLPSGSKGFKSEYLAPTVLLCASHTLSDNLGFGYNFGATWDGYNPKAIGKYSAVIGWGASDKLGVFGEVFGEFQKDNGVVLFDAGVTYLVAPNFQLDASAGLGLNELADDYFISCGFSWRLPN